MITGCNQPDRLDGHLYQHHFGQWQVWFHQLSRFAPAVFPRRRHAL